MSKIDKIFKNKKIIFLGLGIENFSLVKFLIKKKITYTLVIADPAPIDKIEDRWKVISALAKKNNFEDVYLRDGKDYDDNLEHFDLIVRSPGYPLFSKNLKRAKDKRVEISSAMKVFFELTPTSNIIGVTGTKGKGTTSSLIHDILKQAKKDVWLGGNIGIPPFNFIEDLNKNSWVVLELSSFQLEDIEKSPKIAVITNFYKEHLKPADPSNPNYHKKLKDYLGAKLNIVRYQKKQDKVVVNKKFEMIVAGSKCDSKIITFSKSDLESKLFGEHNKENIAAAEEVAKIINIKKEDIKRAVKKYKSLEHRLELVLETKHKIRFFDDSFATTPESTITALKSFESPIILLAGGADKGSDFNGLAKIINEKVKFLILFSGKATPRLRARILEKGFSKLKIKTVYNIEEAIKISKEKAEFGDIVLLSTACASFGLFKNYKERGNLFKEEVKKVFK